MKKKLLVIIITIVLCLIGGIGGYYLTLLIDNTKKSGDLKVNVTYEDTDTYTIPSNKKMTKEEALKEWPYIIHLENDSDGKGSYQILIEDVKKDIPREDLEFILYLDEKEISSGKLSNVKDNILYTGEIEPKIKHDYKLYIWAINEEKEESTYEYKLVFNTIKSGGPGF